MSVENVKVYLDSLKLTPKERLFVIRAANVLNDAMLLANQLDTTNTADNERWQYLRMSAAALFLKMCEETPIEPGITR